MRKGGGLNFLFPAGGPIFQSELIAAAGEPVLFGKALSDGSVFPSSGGWPPTLTIMANALRIGEGIREAMGRKEL